MNPSTWHWLQKVRFLDDFVIEIKDPSIAGHLSLSHLPELLIKENVYKRVFLSERSAHDSPEGVYDFVWKNNPYITGIVKGRGWKLSKLKLEGGNTLDTLVHQFTQKIPVPGSTHPVLYKPERFQAFKDEHYMLIDLNSTSTSNFLNIAAICKHLEDAIKSTQGRIDSIYMYQNPFLNKIFDTSSLLQKLASAKLLKTISPEKNLSDYASRIKHAKHVFCLYSDTSFLAAALRTPTTVFCMPKDSSRSFTGQAYVSL